MAHHAPRFLQIVEAVRVNIRECSVGDVRARHNNSFALRLLALGLAVCFPPFPRVWASADLSVMNVVQ